VLEEHSGQGAVVAYLYPKISADGRARVSVVNRKLRLSVTVDYSTRQFPRCGNWQHWGRHEYVAAFEPMNGTVDGRDKDRARGLLDHLKPGERRTYDYRITAATENLP
jgi:galactose mutarotase-like enzyme